MKYQIATDHSGAIIWYSGPHLGTIHDNRLWREYQPALADGERWLADRAYTAIDNIDVIAQQYKRPRGGQLTEPQQLHNKIHGWYRATVEHTIGTSNVVDRIYGTN